MRVRVLFFAGAREVVGVGEEERSLAADVRTVRDFACALADAYPALAPHMPRVRIARNERFAEPDEALAEGDVLAILPPVAGG
jgi:molybdopterin converting factor subunit 1